MSHALLSPSYFLFLAGELLWDIPGRFLLAGNGRTASRGAILSNDLAENATSSYSTSIAGLAQLSVADGPSVQSVSMSDLVTSVQVR